MSIRSVLQPPLLTLALHDGETRWTCGHGPNITSFGSVALAPGRLADGVVVEPAAAARALLGAPDFPRARRSRSVIALPAQRSIVRRLAVPSLTGKQFAELVDREVRREMPMLADNAYVAWQRTGDRADGTTNIFVAGVARDVLDSHLATARAAGLHPIAADLRIIAAARAFGAPDSIVASIEDGHLELVILREGVPDLIRYVALARDADDGAWGAQVTEELARTLKFYRDSHREDDRVDSLPVMLVGGSAGRALLVAPLAASIGHEVAMPELRHASLEEGERVRFAANIGLALKDVAA